jgi:hypothetical protein
MLKKVFKLAQAAEVTREGSQGSSSTTPGGRGGAYAPKTIQHPLCRTAALAVEASMLPPLAQLNAATVLLGEQEVNILYEPTTET